MQQKFEKKIILDMKSLNNLDTLKTIAINRWNLKTFSHMFDIIAKYVDLNDHIIPDTRFMLKKSDALCHKNAIFKLYPRSLYVFFFYFFFLRCVFDLCALS